MNAQVQYMYVAFILAKRIQNFEFYAVKVLGQTPACPHTIERVTTTNSTVELLNADF